MARKATTPKTEKTEKPPKTNKSSRTKAAAPEVVNDGDVTEPVATKAPNKRGSKKNLVIVESPAKAKTIQKYLGPDFEVEASKGHVRDLPKTKFGIDIEKGWVPTYTNLTDRKDLLSGLKKQAAKAGMVYLAPDPDREGEAIAWHLKEALELDDDKTLRVTFNEITKTAIQKAFASPRMIDTHLVNAQETRRFLDRVVGYKLSPLLRKTVTKNASAGRVQSVAVRLIVEREREIQAFKPEEYWKITAELMPEVLFAKLPKDALKKEAKKEDLKKPDEEEAEAAELEGELPPPEPEPDLPEGAFTAELAEWQGKKFECDNGEKAKGIVEACQKSDFVVHSVEQKDRQEKPQAPFTTSTLQQQAALRLRYSAKRTMMVAQKLYEGVDLGSEGSIALITYMRTDSVRVSDDALKTVRSYIETSYGKPYLPEAPNKYQSGKSAQEGHEAVRPTDITQTPTKVQPHLTPEQFKLYDLIYRRFVASQMSPAVFAVTDVQVKAAEGIFKSQGKILKFDGYRKVLAPGKREDAILPSLTPQEKLACLTLAPSQHFTQPPPRFNEASLVKTLEKEGIGRPSTYAAIISKIQDRNYVEQKERRFYATDLGMVITDALVEHFPKIIDLKFTSHMEDELDDIENNKTNWKVVLNEFYDPFAESLKVAETKMSANSNLTDEPCPQCGAPLKIRFSKRGKFLGCSKYPECKYIKPREGEEANQPELTDHICTDCGKQMLKRMGKNGPFLACSGYPECKMTMTLTADGRAEPTVQKTEHSCEKCGQPMVLREGKRGKFLACSGYPKCKNAKDVDKDGNPMKPIDTGVSCDKCGGPMAIRKGPRGPFLGCAAYPKCRNAKPLTDELKEKLKDILPPPPPKKELPEIGITVNCDDCGAEMKLRSGRSGYFFGCSKYPKCKGTKKLTPETEELIMKAMGQSPG